MAPVPDDRHAKSEEELEAATARAVSGALKSAIRDKGPITPDKIGSATKRVVGNLKNARPPTSAAAAALGRLGGKAGRGKSKRRTKAHYAAAGAAGRGKAKGRSRAVTSRWASMTAEERSAEMSRRRKKGLKKKGA